MSTTHLVAPSPNPYLMTMIAMEGVVEKRWRRDAAWAIVVIVAAAGFLYEMGAGIWEELAGIGKAPAPDIWPGYTLEGLLLRYILLLFFVGCSCFFLYAGALAAGVKIFPPADRRGVPWSLWDVARAAAAAYFAGLAVVLAAVRISGAGTGAPWVAVFAGYALHATIAGFSVWFIAARGGTGRDLGFTLRGWHAALPHGILGYLATVPVLYVVALIVGAIGGLLRFQFRPHPLVPILTETKSAAGIGAIIFLITVFGPVTEEVFFRGYLYRAMRRRLSVAGAVIINAALFALIHKSVFGFPQYLVLGMAMAYLFEKTQSLVACSTFHALHNSLQVILAYHIMITTAT